MTIGQLVETLTGKACALYGTFGDCTAFMNTGPKEKQFGTTVKRKQMAEFVKDQKNVRKTSYDPNSREAKSNENWTGKEGLDGITSLPVSKKD